jgi:hypothetical protein
MGVHLLDYLQLEYLRLACEARRRWEFLFVVAPLRSSAGRALPSTRSQSCNAGSGFMKRACGGGRLPRGGVVAWQLAGHHPDRVATLTAAPPRIRGPLPGRWSPVPRRCGRPTSRCSASLGCPSCCWAGTGSGGCAGYWPRTGWAPNGSTPTPGKAREGGPVDTPAIELGGWSNLSRDHRPAGPGPGHRPRRVQDVGIGSARRKGHGAAIRQGSEPGGDPPKPPGAASPPGPSTAHGVRNPTAERRRETGAAAPGFADRTLFPGGCPVLSS